MPKNEWAMTVNRSIRMDEEVYNWLSELARAEKKNVSDVIRMILEEAKKNGWRP